MESPPCYLYHLPQIMKIHSAEFVTSSADLDNCPESTLPEIAMIGRSNVGKSSLINALTNKEGLARVSSRPGLTALINFFEINSAWTMVDLPGYGYARRSAAEQAEFNEAVSDYLVNRSNLICVFILIDSKIPPQKLDLDFVEWVVSNEIPFALIFTKTDRSKPGAVTKNIDAFKAELATRCQGEPITIPSSIKTRKTHLDILEFIDAALAANA